MSAFSEFRPRGPSGLIQVVSDGRTVWVNGEDGFCIGRFSSRGVDVHSDYEAQMRGESQCLDGVHDLPFAESWERFKASMLEHYQICLDDVPCPADTRALTPGIPDDALHQH